MATLILRLIGWRTVFVPPPGPKSVVLVYPHTSNWDFPLGVLCKARHRMILNWAGKDSLFRWPLKGFFIWLGGVPINRRESTGMIRQLIDIFAQSESFCICITPEGTRSRSEHWKTGFYQLALATGVPVGLGFIDYGNRRIGVDRWINLSGSEETDLDLFRSYYADKTGRYPEKAGDIRFR
ncbi:MAG: 1-acyl-sn-glycerol-3-phosphate acyltransferase [Propionivibrio sp.]|uniref:1-acyl-sn-glycerol-3-phosphate acyltransferase n=1 Tax=Candidatus Propionivibrio dominans TaxID=2954373 RepID=A0A9D7IEM8_9RHOO|nr:1-acyl-sn-glycerol-3-phosphate acyltransferase [Candidatus Propionivibrio dominans]